MIRAYHLTMYCVWIVCLIIYNDENVMKHPLEAWKIDWQIECINFDCDTF